MGRHLGASPEPADVDQNQPILNLQNQTVRERVRISVGGSRVRICLTNEYGSSPLLVGSVTVAVPTDPAGVKSGSIQAVTFGGRSSITIPAGAPAMSDPVALPVAYGAEISISLYFPKRVTTPTEHALALKRAVVSAQGDHTYDEKIQGGTEASSLVFVSAVLVPAQPSQHLVVAFGDSIVDGDGSTFDGDRNWPSDLIRRLAKTPDNSKLAVVNEGIAGNRLLANGPIATLGVSALARFDRDEVTRAFGSGQDGTWFEQSTGGKNKCTVGPRLCSKNGYFSAFLLDYHAKMPTKGHAHAQTTDSSGLPDFRIGPGRDPRRGFQQGSDEGHQSGRQRLHAGRRRGQHRRIGGR